MPRWVRSDTLLVRRGVRVGLFGLSYVGTPRVTLATNVAHLRFEDDSATAARLVPALRKRWRPQLVIEIGHTPGRDRLDAARLGRPGAARARGPGRGPVDGRPQPQLRPRRDRRRDRDDPGLAGPGGRRLRPHGGPGGRARRGAPCPAHHHLRRRGHARQHPRRRGWRTGTRAWRTLAATPIGRNARTLTRGRGGESTLGDLVADAMRAEAKADMAFTNSGGLRADLPAGTITRGSVYEVIPFDNTLVMVRLTGARVRDAARGRAWPMDGSPSRAGCATASTCRARRGSACCR